MNGMNPVNDNDFDYGDNNMAHTVEEKSRQLLDLNELLPQKTMIFEMSSTDLATAVEYYLNSRLFRTPVSVISVEKLALSGSGFKIEFLRQGALASGAQIGKVG